MEKDWKELCWAGAGLFELRCHRYFGLGREMSSWEMQMGRMACRKYISRYFKLKWGKRIAARKITCFFSSETPTNAKSNRYLMCTGDIKK